MKNRHLIKHGATAVALAMILGISAAHSAEVFLQAEEYQKTIAYGSGGWEPDRFGNSSQRKLRVTGLRSWWLYLEFVYYRHGRQLDRDRFSGRVRDWQSCSVGHCGN